jgi:hypothetical protein
MTLFYKNVDITAIKQCSLGRSFTLHMTELPELTVFPILVSLFRVDADLESRSRPFQDQRQKAPRSEFKSLQVHGEAYSSLARAAQLFINKIRINAFGSVIIFATGIRMRILPIYQ